MNALSSALENEAKELLPELESIYKDLHRNPELSMVETRTAGIAADYLVAEGFEVTRQVGPTGVVGILKNGDGPTVMLRADMDALPIVDATGGDHTHDQAKEQAVIALVWGLGGRSSHE